MKKTTLPNFLVLTIANILFCMVLIIIGAFLEYTFKLNLFAFMSSIILLIVGIYNGLITAKASNNNKLLYSCITALIFAVIYSVICFILKTENSATSFNFIPIINIFVGSIIGSILSASKIKKGKGFKK